MIRWLLQENLEVLSLLTQVDRKMHFGEATSFHETEKRIMQYDPVYRNQAKPRTSQKPRSRETLLGRIKPSPALLSAQQLNAFGCPEVGRDQDMAVSQHPH